MGVVAEVLPLIGESPVPDSRSRFHSSRHGRSRKRGNQRGGEFSV